ncbi:MAG: pyridoxal-dependent decarboxylase [Pirellulaceae bacterium]|nr:pyridoxal-dependent decarboxylase [Pirellulaceae bacterium]
MSSAYQTIVQSLRSSFPQPVSDRVHDAYFVFSCLRALDQLDAMKSVSPLLGSPEELDYDAARRRQLADAPRSLEDVTRELVEHFSGMFIWSHPRSQINVIPPPTIASIIGGLLPSIYNPNLCSDDTARKVAVAEVEAVSMTAHLVGYDPLQAGGLFTFGGTGALLYGVKLGLEKACPGAGRRGLSQPPVILCSQRAHYACLTVANWLGIGEENVVRVPATADSDIVVEAFEESLRTVLRDGRPVAAIVATMGTTDAFGIDDLAALHRIRSELAAEFQLATPPHLHADAVIGWAWSVFNDYDWDANPLGFRLRTIRCLAAAHNRIRHLHLADSLGVDFHKTGFTPYISSAFLVRDAQDLRRLARGDQDMPYLFQSGHHHPGKYTLETTRGGSGPMAALANLLLLGKDGLRALLGHLVTMAETLREHLGGHVSTTVFNRNNVGPVTLFRVYPDGIDTFTVPKREESDPQYRPQLLAHNAYNRRIYQIVHQDALRGEGAVLSMTDCYRETDYGEPIVALKSYIMSPFSDEASIDAILNSIWKARRIVAEESAAG